MEVRCWTFLSAVGFLVVAVSSAAAAYDNSTLWDGLMADCSASASFSCVSASLRRSLENALNEDFIVTDSIVFKKKAFKYSAEANTQPPEVTTESTAETITESTTDGNVFSEFVEQVEEAEDSYYNEGRQKAEETSRASSISSLSDILYSRGVRYLLSHDLELGLPQLVFGGGQLRISPLQIDSDGGVLTKVYFNEPKESPPLDEPEERTQGKEQESEPRFALKKIRHFFKKKLMSSFMAAMLIIKLVKVKLLFLLPLIVGVTTAKKILLKVLLFLFPALAHLFKLCAYYHHQHTKYHLHHHHQIAHHHHHPAPVYYPAYSSPSVEYAHPPPGAEIVHRTEPQTNNELSSWGIEYDGEPISRIYSHDKNAQQPSVGVLPAGHLMSGPLPPGGHLMSGPLPPGGQVVPGQLVSAAAPAPLPPAARGPDLSYPGILSRLDRVFGELGFTTEACRERLVCSMYKAPARFSPHSNLVSNEVSREPSELEKPDFSKSSVIRFYRYVEAARLGQEGKDCLALFPACPLLTE